MLDALLAPFNAVAFHAFDTPTTWGEVLGFASGALCVWAVARQWVWNWPVGIANNLLFLLLFASSGLYADSGLQLVYVVLALYGWWAWLHRDVSSARRELLPVSTTSSAQWLYLVGAGALATGVLYYVLTSFTNSSVPLLDALTTAVSLMATWGQTRKKLESWYLWILADVVYVPLYQYKGLTLTAVLYVGFMLLCVLGLVSWRRDLRTQAVLVPAGVGA